MSTRICPSCDEPVAENDRICDVCNTPLRPTNAKNTASLKPRVMSPIVLPAIMPDPPPATEPEKEVLAEQDDELTHASDHELDSVETPEAAETPATSSAIAEVPEMDSDRPEERVAETDFSAEDAAMADTDAASADEESSEDLSFEAEADNSTATPLAQDEQVTVSDLEEETEADLTLGEVEQEQEPDGAESDAAHSEAQSIPEPPQEASPIKIEMVPQTKIPPPPMDMPKAAEPFSFKPQDAEPQGATAGSKAQPFSGTPAPSGNPLFNQAAATPMDVALQIKKETLTTAKHLTQLGYHLYGLFGRPSAGKSSMIYALRQHFLKGDVGFGGYTPEGPEWDELAKDLEEQWRVNRPVPTKDKLHPFRAISSSGGKHIAMLDIAGERFEGIQNWTEEIFDFFDLYFDHCKGMFFLIELDDLVGSSRVDYGASMRIQSQMSRIIRFLAVAGNRDKWRRAGNLGKKRAKLQKAIQQKNVRIDIPVALCLTKADMVNNMNFGPALGRIIPGSLAPESDPWNVLQAVWPEHVASLLDMVPFLKVDWLSCLGTNFETEKRYTQSVGLRGVFQHVVLNPPKPWTLSTKRYLQMQKWLRL